MRRASVREARQNLSALLEHVAKGHEVLITSRGEPAARLVPPRPKTGKPFPDRKPQRKSMPRLDPPLSVTVAEGREERG
jgi:prevent-host-death family protein